MTANYTELGSNLMREVDAKMHEEEVFRVHAQTALSECQCLQTATFQRHEDNVLVRYSFDPAGQCAGVIARVCVGDIACFVHAVRLNEICPLVTTAVSIGRISSIKFRANGIRHGSALRILLS